MEQLSEEERKKWMKKANWIVKLTIAYLLFDIAILYLTMQNSQAMKAAWVEDMLYLIPSISFLIAAGRAQRPPDKEYRYGYARAFSAGFLISAIALFAIGSFLLYDSAKKLVTQEVVSIGSVSLFGETIWFGWVMMLAIGYSILPVYLIGKKKLKIAKKLDFQILYVDAKGQKADWLTSVATIFGIAGMGMGLWWADAAAALVIAVDIISDGVKSLKASFGEVMDRTPLDTSMTREETILEKVEEVLREEVWVKDYLVRFRKAGNKNTGEVLLVLQTGENLQENLHELRHKIMEQDWRLTEVVVAPVEELPLLIDKKIGG